MPFISPPLSEESHRLPVVDLSRLSGHCADGVLTAISFFTIITGILIVVIDGRKRAGQQASW
ncbi:MAG TPA: hypothetical protein VFZ67_11495 [Nitrososphaera sp.]